MAALATGAYYPHDRATVAAAARARQDISVMNPRRIKFWLLAALGFGVLVLPFLVHLTGTRVFGPYTDGGAGAFFGAYLRGLATLQWYSWVLALGPFALAGMWSILVRWRSTSRG